MWDCFQRILYHIINIGFRIIDRELTDDIFQSIMQFIKFGIVGVSNTVISYVIYVAGLLFFAEDSFFTTI